MEQRESEQWDRYTVLTTSGWVGAGWHIDSYHARRADALARADAIHQTNARDDGYITAVVGRARPCLDHQFGCYIVDTRRVPVRDAHLRGRQVHARAHVAEDSV